MYASTCVLRVSIFKGLIFKKPPLVLANVFRRAVGSSCPGETPERQETLGLGLLVLQEVACWLHGGGGRSGAASWPISCP